MTTQQYETTVKEKENALFVGNLRFPMLSTFKTENIESALDFQHQDDDIIICSYPKTGTTWVQCIVLQMLYKDESLPNFFDLQHKIVPFIEMTGKSAVEKLKSPRFYKTHIPYNMLKTNPQAKYIYVYRDPKDTLVSYHYFKMGARGQFFNFDDSYEAFVSGDMPYGNYFDHVLSFYAHKNDSNVLMISYEDLYNHRQDQILKIAQFLGPKYHEMLSQDEHLLQKIVTASDFNRMKQHFCQSFPEPDDDVANDKRDHMSRVNKALFRKGIVGEGKRMLSSDQITKLNTAIMIKMQGTEFVNSWLTSPN